jgi:hypothetical protein
MFLGNEKRINKPKENLKLLGTMVKMKVFATPPTGHTLYKQFQNPVLIMFLKNEGGNP